MSWGYVAEQALNVVLVSALYGLMAVAYVLMHGVTSRLNLAVGSLSAWAGAVTVMVALRLALELPATAWPLLVAAAAVAALLNTTALGLAAAALVVRPLRRQGTLAMMIASLGLALVIEETIRLLAGSHEMWLPPLGLGTLAFGGGSMPVAWPVVRMLAAAAALATAGGLLAVIAFLPFGRAWRAAAEDPGMAALCGLDTDRLTLVTFALATAALAFAGILVVVTYGAVTFYSGLALSLKTLLIAIIGGLGSLPGALAGALALGVFETAWSASFGAENRDIAAFAALTLLMLLRPAGLRTPPPRRDQEP